VISSAVELLCITCCYLSRFVGLILVSLLLLFFFVAVGPRYKLQGHIGSGTYGDVCKALDLEFNQIIALKVQHPLCSTPPHPTPPLTLGILEAEMLAQLHAWL
jgi:hypothetical protein